MRTLFITVSLLLGWVTFASAQTATSMPTGKKFYIQSAMNFVKNNGGYWDIPGYPSSSSDPIKRGSNIQVFDLDNHHDREFTLIKSSVDGYYEIQVGNTRNSRVDIQGRGTQNGANVHTWDRTGNANQQFLFHHLGDGRFKIYDRNSGKILCLLGRNNANRTNVHLWNDHNGASVEWYLIDVQTKRPFIPQHQQQQQQQQQPQVQSQPQPQHNNMIPLPEGKVVVPSGYNVQDVEVRFYLNKYKNNPLITKPNPSGYYSFPNAQIDDNDWYAVVLAVADGLVSDYYSYHKTIAPGNIELKLTYPTQGTKLVYSLHRGNIPFASNSKYYVNTKGTIDNKQDNFFFRNLNSTTPQKKKLRELIGVSGIEAKTDKEIYDIAKKTWAFYSNAKRNSLGNVPDDVKRAFDESLNREWVNGPVTYWTTVEQFVDIYNKYGFMPVGNCTSQTLALAAFLRVAGVPANKMAVQRLHYDFYQEHWAVIIELNNVWYWFDPTYSFASFPNFEQLISIPSERYGYEHHIPFDIITMPGSTLNYVPYCGEDGVIK